MKKNLLLTLALLLSTTVGLMAQGVTTASISGKVTGTKTSMSAEQRTTSAGEALPGANVVATHLPSGTVYGTSTRADGGYSIPNVRIGGPYKITASFVGYNQQEKNDLFLSLGNTTNIEFQLTESGTELQSVVVSASKSDIFNSDRTGAATNVGNSTIQSIPNISRGLRDFTKLSPFANTSGNGTSFGGANNRYNQFSIDGLVNNDVFGLSSSGTNGGQTGIEPISLDAIEEIQLNIAPYDVRQGGFTGGGINAVTRSGTNKFQGSAYYFGNNESLVGENNPNTNVKAKFPTYIDYQTGFRLGGPIIKDKLFFFVNGELTRRKTPLAFQPGDPSSNITIAEVNSVLSVINAVAPNYDPGAFDNITNVVNSDKIFAKLDWNINDSHKLTARHSYTYGEQIDNSRSPNALRFYNNGLFFPSTTNSTGIELNSRFSNKYSNRLLIGRTSVLDDRDPLGRPFPFTVVNIGGGKTITFGSENSSVANRLEQTITSLTNDFSIYSGKHTFTIGTNNEFYKFYNLFVQNIYGSYGYPTLTNFQTVGTPTETAPSQYQIGYSFDQTDDPSQSKGAADFSAFQLGLYAQDEFQFKNNLKLTFGLRADLPIFPDKPAANDAYNNVYGASGKTGEVPQSQILWSPRVGFNWDIKGDKTIQVRGGTGLFTGRVPFVWVSNQFTNNGQVNGTYSIGTSAGTPLATPAGIRYNPNPFIQKKAEDFVPPQVAGRGDINTIDSNFKFPQVWRTNIGIDKTLPWGLTATFEAVFSKTLNNVNFTHLNRVEDPTFVFNAIDKRPRYSAANASPTNPGYNQAGRKDPNFNEIINLKNTDEGYSYNLVFQLQKQFDKGLAASIAYTYGDSKDLNSGTSNVAYSNWRFVNNVNGLNNLSTTTSNFSTGSRIVGFVSYKKAYLNDLMSTQISLFYNGQSGQPISYIYNGDLNNDGLASNDLIYVPQNQSDINLVAISITVNGASVALTPQDQWNNLNAFIEGDQYLKSRRGGYAERNGSRLPFQDQIDFRILQEFSIKSGNSTNKLQFSFDIINFGNLLNDSWGRQYFTGNQQFQLINFTTLNDDTAPGVPVNFSTNTPNFTYIGAGQTNGKPYSASDLSSRWRAQFGIRYIFN
ncbi:MAG: carboxypeptidase regulatory-like domain-containing protein [Cyclobacteriaceae bacterium]|nr:carboxypeptidase regulatory-like domain-containing protein [Cyclobacteriaceae bacterium]